METLRVVLALAAKMNSVIRFYDCRTAYIHASVDLNTIFMERPAGLTVKDGGDKVCHLLKSLYGLAQSGRNWYLKVCEVFEMAGLQKLESDDCVFVYEENGLITLVVIFIDDFMMIAPNDNVVDNLVDKLKRSLDVVETLGDNYLGLKILKNDDGIIITQQHYVDKMLEKFGMQDARAVASPGIPTQNLDKWGDSPIVDSTAYQEKIGSLLYLATVTRPDLAFVVTNLARYSKEPHRIHENAVNRVFKYLKGTRELGLHYRKCDIAELNGIADASWDVTADGKSFSGYLVRLGHCLVTWKSKKQDVVALSTCEAETVALVNLVKELKWLQGLLAELQMLGNFVKYPVNVQTDSQAAIGVINNSNAHTRTKHFRRSYHFVRQEIQKQNLTLNYVSTDENLADGLTKNIPGVKLSQAMDALWVKSVT